MSAIMASTQISRGSEAEDQRVLNVLVQASRKHYANPYVAFDWPDSVDGTSWYVSPELVSLHDTDPWHSMTEAQQKKLSFFEAVNLFTLIIHGEKILLRFMVPHLLHPHYHDESAYLSHFLDEENKHIAVFGEFCLRYAGKLYPDRHYANPREYADGEADFLSFASALIFEEIGNYFNLRIGHDSRCHSIARQLNIYHHRDESRHLVFGRQMTRKLFQRHAPNWTEDTLAGVRQYLANYMLATWREYFIPDTYRDAGLDDAYSLRRIAISSPASQARFEAATEGLVRYLLQTGILLERPAYDVGI